MKILVTFPSSLEADFFVNQQPIETEVLITGVGVPSTIYQLQKALTRQRYDIVLQAGVCGSFNVKEHPMGSTVLIQKDVFADIGIIEDNNFISMNELGFIHSDEKNFEQGWLENKSEILNKLLLPKCSAITVNTIAENGAQNALFQQKYHPQIETMEGASLHYVCLLQDQVFLQVRTVSNEVGERDKAKWILKEAITNMTKELHKLIEFLKHEL